MSSAHHSSSGL
ncbi:hypothetical protein E2C01_065345 [Portunus trituberculatus]|uniref:Uncharacterized protein n=1 Tax=Portunus trituberculatus TaxID=210409 RepID=A0A5B7HMB8_PORTR|nr:hypothetical protein [Portunus trituberculatus]